MGWCPHQATMHSWLEIVGVAWHATVARPLRSGLLVVGAAAGVAIAVGARGTLQSGKGEIREALDRLGTNIVVVEATDPSGTRSALPAAAARRASAVSTVESVAWTSLVDVAPSVSPRIQGFELGDVSTPVTVASPDALTTLAIPVVDGRPLGAADEAAQLRSAVVGARLAETLGADSLVGNTVWIGDTSFGVVGVLAPSPLAPELDAAVLIPRATAEAVFGASVRPTRLYLRVDQDLVDETARLLPLAVGYGGPETISVRLASDLLEAQAVVDTGLQSLLLGVGLLAVGVGALGIFNTLHISLLERRREIGLRRACGHPRWAIGAQFVVEASLVGLIGGAVGAIAGIVFVVAMARRHDWVVVLDPAVPVPRHRRCDGALRRRGARDRGTRRSAGANGCPALRLSHSRPHSLRSARRSQALRTSGWG